ncbi:MAG: rhodanese-like domain-containing protein [Gammaproteobacteria bacterium]|nr:rhodanese-like domain-containing protein [Gammaproteobacteria bacterium]
MKLHSVGVVAVTLLMATQLWAAGEDEFPGRKFFPAVPYIGLEELYNKRNDVIIVDVRTAYEYETLRIKGAINISVHNASFPDEMQKLRDANPSKLIVTYCNGKTCNKSYEAVQACRNHNIPNVVAYDAGIYDWAKKYPLESELLGKGPLDLSKLITNEAFKKHNLDIKKFSSMVGNDDVIVLDVRDRFQRDASSLFPGVDRRAALDDKPSLERYFQRAKRENKTLLIYDAAGKQAEWLIYYLEDKGISNYYFMSGGATAYYKELRKEFAQ